MVLQLYNYKTTELYTVHRWISWYMNFIFQQGSYFTILFIFSAEDWTQISCMLSALLLSYILSPNKEVLKSWAGVECLPSSMRHWVQIPVTPKIKLVHLARHQWLIPIILAAWETEMGRIMVWGQTGPRVSQTPSQPIVGLGDVYLSSQLCWRVRSGWSQF
jgi:hypothetical protein